MFLGSNTRYLNLIKQNKSTQNITIDTEKLKNLRQLGY